MKNVRFAFTIDATDDYKHYGLPKRKTTGSAGYDFISPVTVTINPGETVKIPTYIKAYMPKGVVLKLYVRSSLGIKKNLCLPNNVGIIDSDYAGNPDNDGNIIGALYNFGSEPQTIKAGEAFMQGVFVSYITTEDDDSSGIRIGGIGSTSEMDKQEAVTCMMPKLDEIAQEVTAEAELVKCRELLEIGREFQSEKYSLDDHLSFYDEEEIAGTVLAISLVSKFADKGSLAELYDECVEDTQIIWKHCMDFPALQDEEVRSAIELFAALYGTALAFGALHLERSDLKTS